MYIAQLICMETAVYLLTIVMLIELVETLSVNYTEQKMIAGKTVPAPRRIDAQSKREDMNVSVVNATHYDNINSSIMDNDNNNSNYSGDDDTDYYDYDYDNNTTIATTTFNVHAGYVGSRPPRELPIPLIIASPVVAVGIIIFLLIAFYWHSVQLDARAREFALQFNVIPEDNKVKGKSSTAVETTESKKKVCRNSRTPSIPPLSNRRASIHQKNLGEKETMAPPPSSARRQSTFIL